MDVLKKNFTFWFPLEKSEEVVDSATGEQIMRLGGIASTSDKDSDGEFLDPKGFDIQPLLKSGMVNWHHQAKGQPATIIGEPTKAEIRPEGLYIETDLYPSSQIARDVWELANTLAKDSKTRRLGYSIEGKVLKRKNNDPSNPDYKKVEKAVITGVAITHMPKNPKTFANIIKGEVDDDDEPEDDEMEKELNTKNAAPLKKESVDKEVKTTCFAKSELYTQIFKIVAGIDIAKAKEIYNKICSDMISKNKQVVTEDDIVKAYEELGFGEISKAEDCQKSDDVDDDKAKNQKEPSDDDETEEEETVEEQEGDDTPEDDDEDEDDDTKKAVTLQHFNAIEKAIAIQKVSTEKYIKALGAIMKDVNNNLQKAESRENKLLELIKAQDEQISSLQDQIENFGNISQGRKSITNARAVDRQFSKGGISAEEFLEKGDNVEECGISMSRQSKVVAEILDQATFAKGTNSYDEEFGKACVSFEATHTLPQDIIQRLKNEFNVTIVK